MIWYNEDRSILTTIVSRRTNICVSHTLKVSLDEGSESYGDREDFIPSLVEVWRVKNKAKCFML